MAKNRKYRSAAIRFGPPLKAFLLCLFIGGSGVGYVWQKNQLNELGKQIKQREGRLLTLAHQNEDLKNLLSKMNAPAVLQEKIKKAGLVQPLPSQIWRLPEPREWMASEPERPLAAQDGRMASALERKQ